MSPMLPHIVNALFFFLLLGLQFGLLPDFSSDNSADDDNTADEQLPVEQPEIFEGTEGNDDVLGSTSITSYLLLGGDDSFTGTSQSEYVVGGAGADNISLRVGNDTALGQTGDDHIEGGFGNDILDGGDDNDTLFGNANDDILVGGAGNDTLNGGAGSDQLFGNSGNDILNGLYGDESFSTNVNKPDLVDTLDGGDGDDRLILGSSDIGFGGSGSDVFHLDKDIAPDSAAIVSDFDATQDTLEIEYSPAFDAGGAEIPPLVEVTNFDDETGASVSLNGTVVAQIIGAQNLDPNSVVLVPWI